MTSDFTQSVAPHSAQQLPAVLSENGVLREQVVEFQEQVTQLKQQLAWFKRQLFGAKSEKRVDIDPAIQADLLSQLGVAPVKDALPATENISYQRRKKSRDNSVNDSGLRFDESVPVKTIRLPCVELEGADAEAYEFISEKETYRLAQRPGSYVILKYVRKVIKRKETQAMITSPAPDNVLDNSLSDVSFLAGQLVDKFVYHLPLYRQHQRLQQSGIQLSRSTLTHLARRAIDLLSPIVDAQFQHVLQSKTLAMDETPIKAGRKQKGKMRQAYFWPVYGEQDEIVFHYSGTRAARVVNELLGEFQGTLLTDGYDAYKRYAQKNSLVTHAECWAHTRRYFERAESAEPQAAQQALALIGALYQHEQRIRDKNREGDAKLKHRTEHSEPIVKQFWAWCENQCQRHDLLPSNPLTKALKYAMGRQQSLQVFLTDPEVPIDTNHLERALRPIPMGRKNWLFCWTELGAKQVGIIQSLLVTCKLHSINPHTYLVDVLQRINQHPASKTIELTPRIWKEKFAANPLRSDLESLGQ